MQYKESSAVAKVRRDFQDWLKETIKRFALPFETAISGDHAIAAPFDTATLRNLSAPAQETLRYYLGLWGHAVNEYDTILKKDMMKKNALQRMEISSPSLGSVRIL